MSWAAPLAAVNCRLSSSVLIRARCPAADPLGRAGRLLLRVRLVRARLPLEVLAGEALVNLARMI